MDVDYTQPIAHHASATQTALALLERCLVKNGALMPGQFSAELKATFNKDDAAFGRLDYEWLRNLAVLLDKSS